jgi:hypothetical protein
MPKKRKLPVPGKGKGKGKKLRPFHQFNRLPADLRVHIWKLVDPEPRVVELRRHVVETKKRGTLEQIRCLSAAPAILHACRESRRITIQEKLYERAFIRGQCYAWVNYKVDMISIGSLDIWWFRPEMPLIQRFRFESENDESFFYFQSKRLRGFTGLKELHIVCLDAVGYWVNVAEEMYFPTENVFFIGRGPENTTMCSRQQLFEMNPSRPLAEYSNSYYRQKYDKRIKGTEEDAPDGLLFGVPTAE